MQRNLIVFFVMLTPLSIRQRLCKAVVFFVSSLIILSLIRGVFFAVYKTPEITFAEFMPAAWMGVRVDAKWLATLAVPAWLLLCLSAWRYVFWRLAVWMAGLATAIAVTVAVINFGFFRFLSNPHQSDHLRSFPRRHDGNCENASVGLAGISVSVKFDCVDRCSFGVGANSV